MTKTQYGLTEMRRKISEILDLIDSGEHVELTNYGYPIAVVISIADYSQLTANTDTEA